MDIVLVSTCDCWGFPPNEVEDGTRFRFTFDESRSVPSSGYLEQFPVPIDFEEFFCYQRQNFRRENCTTMWGSVISAPLNDPTYLKRRSSGKYVDGRFQGESFRRSRSGSHYVNREVSRKKCSRRSGSQSRQHTRNVAGLIEF